jgi:hypothetical protein
MAVSAVAPHWLSAQALAVADDWWQDLDCEREYALYEWRRSYLVEEISLRLVAHEPL